MNSSRKKLFRRLLGAGIVVSFLGQIVIFGTLKPQQMSFPGQESQNIVAPIIVIAAAPAPVKKKTVFLEHEPFLPVPGRVIIEEEQASQGVTTKKDTHVNRMFPEDEWREACKPMSDWQVMNHPNCNEFHQYSMVDGLKGGVLSRLGMGTFRYAWELEDHAEIALLHNNSRNRSLSTLSIVLKNLKLKLGKDYFEPRFYERHRVDAIAMERLTSSPHVVDIYGYCGMSVYTEYASALRIRDVRELPSLDKLNLALQIAKGVADVHGIDGPNKVSLVHHDLSFPNIAVSEDNGRLLINDFNLAVLQRQDKHSGKACPFKTHLYMAVRRSMEEHEDRGVTEKSDMYLLGNVFFALMVGHEAWVPAMRSDGTISHSQKNTSSIAASGKSKKNYTLPHVPSAIRQEKDRATQSLLQIIAQCYQYRPESRPTAKQVVDMIQETIGSLSRSLG